MIRRWALIFTVLGMIVNMLLFIGAIKTFAYSDEENYEKKCLIDPTKNSESYLTVLYNNRNGLPTSEANDIVETSDGFIWIGSYSGLIRYDGKEFVRINSEEGVFMVLIIWKF